ARGRGNATALITRVLAEATRRGARATYLLTEPDGPAVGIYRRAGFGTLTRIGSWVSEPHKMSGR
ncbi:MAG TPA: GNAT family N-acetyltransferase, partial [Actinomycetota bacterium]|nr:GNAT family N-acetyltransferase [Actinomycetota bacterium]